LSTQILKTWLRACPPTPSPLVRQGYWWRFNPTSTLWCSTDDCSQWQDFKAFESTVRFWVKRQIHHSVTVSPSPASFVCLRCQE